MTAPGQTNTRHGSKFLDAAALNPRRAAERALQLLAVGQPLGDDEREALALAVWHSPATSTGRSVLP